jgi:hypothetical protein
VTRVSELYNPCLNIDLGARYLQELLQSHNGDLERALAAYNYGPSRIARATTLPAGASRYVATVSRHRARISNAAASNTERATRRAAGSSMRFDSATRADRYAAALSTQITGADFNSQRAPDGSYQVSMAIAPAGLTPTDVRRLRALGWPGITPSNAAGED